MYVKKGREDVVKGKTFRKGKEYETRVRMGFLIESESGREVENLN